MDDPGERQAAEPLLHALNWAFTFGFPIEVWVAIATALGSRRYQPADAETFARAHPDQVEHYDTADGTLYRPPAQPKRQADPELEDRVAVALVGLLGSPVAERPAVRSYLQRYLPAQCADGTGRGIEALRALPADPETDRLLAAALSRRAGRVPTPRRASIRREAIARYTAAGALDEAIEERTALAATLERSGDLEAALGELHQALAEYQDLASRDPFYTRFVALTLLNIGRLRRDTGRRREARAATKAALEMFRALAREDHRFADEVRLAQDQLRQLRWFR